MGVRGGVELGPELFPSQYSAGIFLVSCSSSAGAFQEERGWLVPPKSGVKLPTDTSCQASLTSGAWRVKEAKPPA